VIEAEQLRRALRGPELPQQEAHRGRLPGAVGTEEAEHLAAADAEGQSEHPAAAAEVLRQSDRPDRELAAHPAKPMVGTGVRSKVVRTL